MQLTKREVEALRITRELIDKLLAEMGSDSKTTAVAKTDGTSVLNEKPYDSLEKIVTDHIHELGMPKHIKGYQYLRTAIMMSVEDPEMALNITKLLKPAIAGQYKTSDQKVERAIRYAIKVVWTKGNMGAIDEIFGYTIDQNKDKPALSEFIATMADHIRINHMR